MWRTANVLPFHYDVPQRCGAAIYSIGPSATLKCIRWVHRALDRCESEWMDLMQALENVTAAGIYFIDCSPRPGFRTRGDNELR